MVLSVSDVVNRIPDAERSVFRFLSPTERLVLQGFAPEMIYHFPTAHLAVKASGNAYPVVLICAVVHPVLKAIAVASDFNFAEWPGSLPGGTDADFDGKLKNFKKALHRQPKLLPIKRRHSLVTNARTEHRKHSSSDSD